MIRPSAAADHRGTAVPPGLPACALVDLDAIAANVAVLREHAGDAGVMAVVKADGYGHGLVPSARAALAGGAAWLGVAQLREALALRTAGVDAPLLAWLTVPGDAFAPAVQAGVDLGISARWALEEAATAARAVGRPARVHLKVDTGLSRNGVGPRDWPDLVDAVLALRAEGTVEPVGLFSHYAWADAPDHPTVSAQTEAFDAAAELAAGRGLHFALRHLANSAATLTTPRARYDLVRPGIAVYGLTPVPELASSAALGLRPAMTLTGRVALVKEVPAGAGVSYGHAYTTPAATTLALVPLGYADGLPRHAGNAGPVRVAGRTFPVAGRVCMDQVVVDLGGAGNPLGVAAGDLAVLFGDGADGGPTAQDWADAAGTISYEIVTRIGNRVPRLYRGAGYEGSGYQGGGTGT
jgi:alanine racemase